jgi:hypothetical protein
LAGLRYGQRGAKQWRHGLAQLRQRGAVTTADVLDLWAEVGGRPDGRQMPDTV